jgi:hypothetical protein
MGGLIAHVAFPFLLRVEEAYCVNCSRKESAAGLRAHVDWERKPAAEKD